MKYVITVNYREGESTVRRVVDSDRYPDFDAESKVYHVGNTLFARECVISIETREVEGTQTS